MVSVVRKMAQYIADVLDPEDKDLLQENLLIGPSKVRGGGGGGWRGRREGGGEGGSF